MDGTHPSEPPGGGPADGEGDGTPDRLVEISLRDAGGRLVGHGSGWVLDEDLILTAAHVLWPAAGADGEDVVIEVRCGNVAPYQPWHRCEIVWLGSDGPGEPTGVGGELGDPDAALLVVTGAGWRPPDPRSPVRLGSQGRAITEFEIFSFPAFLHTEHSAYDVHQCGGRLRPAHLSRSPMRMVEVSAEDAPPTPAGWQGISGAAVLVEEQRAVIGVVVGSDQGNVRRLSVLSVTRLTSDPEFLRHSREHRQGMAHNRRKVLAAIRQRLERAEPLQTEGSRRALLARLLPDVVRDPEIVYLDHGSVLAALVDRLAPRSDGFAVLASAYAEAYAEDEVTIGELLFLAEEFRALDALGAEMWLGLREELRKLVQDDLGGVPVPSLYAQAVEGGADTAMPDHCDEPWKAFVRLVCEGTDTERLRFLELVASAVGGSTADTVRQYNRRWAVQRDSDRRAVDGREAEDRDLTASTDVEHGGFAREVDELRRRLISAPVQRPVSARLLVELTPDPNSDPDGWTVSFYFQCRPRPGAWRRVPMPLAERVIRLTQLFDRVETSCHHLRDVYGVPDDRIEIEYILPLDLIDHPDRLIASGGLPHEAASFPLVVHSLDRLHNPAWRAVWQEHWRRNRRMTGQLLFQVNALNQQDTVAAEPVAGVLLTEKPGSDTGRHEVSTALRHGVPLVMWRHHPRAQPDFTALQRRIMAEGRLDVRLFGQDDGGHPAVGDSVWNRQFVIIFDTPENLPGLVYGGAS